MASPPEDGTVAPALFLDGLSAVRHQAVARLAAPMLLIASPEGTTLAEWPIASVRVVAREGGDVRLACGSSDARLILDAERTAPLLAALAGARAPERRWRNVAALGLATLALGAALWFGGPLLADGAARLVPQRAAVAIGEMAVQQVTAGARRCSDPAGQAALDELVARLAPAAGLAEAPSVVVVNRPEVNAFAMPGGRIVLLHGLLMRAEDADELAGVLAHEIGHLRHDHPLRGLMRAVGLGVLASILTGGSDVAALGATLLSLANSRAFEAEADTEAVRILQVAGIGTAGLHRFFARMEEQHLPDVARYLASHPSTAERQAAIPQERGARVAMAPEAWAALRRIC
jgi:Zn-dependent protease with chaperone function